MSKISVSILTPTFLLRQVRFMNYAGCKRKFKVAEFVSKYDGAAKNAANALRLSGKKRKA